MTSPYLLSAQLEGHTSDVRSVSTESVQGGQLILSGSRDGTGRLWHRPASGPAAFAPASVLSGHQGFVNAVTFWRRTDRSLFAVTAGQDKTIRIHSVAHAGDSVAAARDPAAILTGHTENVCALASGPAPDGKSSYLVSASWDKTAKVWREDGTCVATLKGHEMAVWAVLLLPNGQVLTASADKTIRLWDPSRPQAPLAVFMGHKDAIRGLVLVSPAKFASCGNDGTIALYDLRAVADDTANRPVQTLSGHTSFVYSLAVNPRSTGELASSGEDRSVRVWSSSGTLVQTLTLPAISVWSVATLSDGDLVTATNDGLVRVFSRIPAHKASAEQIEVYDAAIASQELNKAQIGDIKVSQLPGQEALQQTGKSEGEVKMVRSADGSKGEAYQWTTGSWQKVGDVTGGISKKQKQLFDGKEWDYVFDVDVQDGAPPLKLPYNVGENAYFAAQRFLERNELPGSFLEEVVQFIDKNTDGASTQASASHRDPFTGNTSYTPGSTLAPRSTRASTGSSSGGYVDPFTGAGSYRPSSSGSAPVAPGVDPYTGVPLGRPKVLPQKVALKFIPFNAAPVKSKLATLASSAGTSGSVGVLSGIVDKVGSGTALTSSELDGLETNVLSWPSEARFPLLDTYRRAVIDLVGADAGQIARTAFQAADWGSWGNSAPSKVNETNAMLALRAVANALAASAGPASSSVSTISELILSSNSGLLASKNARVALATVVLNLAVNLDLGDTSTGAGEAVLQLATAALASEMERNTQADSEAAYRLVVAAGSLATSSAQGSLPVESVMVAKEVAIALSQHFSSESRFADLIAELKAL